MKKKKENKPILIKNGKVFIAEEKKFKKLDILIENGSIKDVKENIPKEKIFEVINAENKIVSPGFTDLHVHLREPGREDEETIETGTLAAISGGFTKVCAMPNTEPPIDTAELVEYVIRRAKEAGNAEVFPVGAITKKREGTEIAELGLMVEKGAVGFSDDGDWVLDSGVMRRALEYSKMFEVRIISHAEDPYLAKEGVMNEGRVSTRLGLYGKPRISETYAIQRDIELAEYTQGKLHIAHLSTKKGVEIIKKAKERGVEVTCEVTPHHLIWTEEELEDFDTNYKVNPPLRTEEDRTALIEGLKEGVIDAIATDHAPHSPEEKEQEFDYAPFGMIGLQTAFSLLYENLVEKGVISLEILLEKLTIGPLRVLFRKFEGIRRGAKANIVIISLQDEWIFDSSTNLSKSRNSPVFGKKLKGRIKNVIQGHNIWEL